MATQTTTSLSTHTSSTSTPSCTTAVPDRNGYVPVEACNAQWAYSPSFPAAIALAVLFGLLTLAHLTLAITFRKRFCWVIIMAATWETVSFILRALGSRKQQNGGYALGTQLLFLLAPLWINAFVYMTAGRLIYFLHPEKKIWSFKAISLGKWFVWLDIVSFIVQGSGGMMLSPEMDEKTMNIGKTIYMSGVGLQQFFIFLFIGLIVKFQLDVQVLERQGLLGAGKNGKWWKWLTYSLYAVLVLITMRIIFRLVEFSAGVDPEKNELPYKESYALGLDAFPMMLALLILVVVHPGLVLRGSESEFPSRKERKAEKKEKKRVKKEEKLERKEERKARKEGKSNDGFVEVEMGRYERVESMRR